MKSMREKAIREKSVKPALKRTGSASSIHSSDDEKSGLSSGENTPREGRGGRTLTSSDKTDSWKSDLDDLESFDLSGKADSDSGPNANNGGKMSKFFKKQAKAFVKNFIDYGPPYNGKGFDVALINECAKPVINHIELHKLLNDRVDPNLPDPEDLYFTPIHWCARNGHFMAMKMLRRAGAQVNVTNEMGLTPLSLAVMMKLPPTRRPDQLKIVKYLLENNADPNIRDKGGSCSIDYAAANQDLELIQLLITFGAKLRRENYILVAKRQPILDKVIDPDCYKLIYEQLLIEENIFYQEQQRLNKIQKEKEHDNYITKLHKTLNDKKEKRQTKLKQIKQEKELSLLETNYYEQLEKEKEEKFIKQSKSQVELNGEWKKNTITNNWDFTVKEYGKITRNTIYESNRKIMGNLHDQYNYDSYNRRWKQLTGNQTGLEINTDIRKTFYLEENDPNKGTLTNNNDNSRSGVNSRVRNRNDVKDIDYRDKNDDALKGIDDLNSLLEY